MTAKLLVREVGQREFVQHNGDFDDDPLHVSAPVGTVPGVPQTGEQKADATGERLTVEGNVEAFQVWSLVAQKQRVWKLEDTQS
jgi:hypothetical protein